MMPKKRSKPRDSHLVTMRLPKKIIVGCFDTLSSVGETSQDIPVSTAIVETLTGFINGFLAQDRIPAYNIEDLERRFIQITNRIPQLDFSDVQFGDKPPINVDVEDIESIINEIYDSVGVENEHSLIKPDPQGESPLPDAPPINWDSLSYMDFSDILAEAPKDRLVEAIGENESAKHILCHVYSVLHQSMWGSAKAEKMLRDLLALYESTGDIIQS